MDRRGTRAERDEIRGRGHLRLEVWYESIIKKYVYLAQDQFVHVLNCGKTHSKKLSCSIFLGTP